MPPLTRHFTRTAAAVGFAGLLGFGSLQELRAAPPASSFGVWDRSSGYDPQVHPFLRGLAFTQSWADVEKTPCAFDWRALDRAMEGAVAKNQFIYLSLNVGPDAPTWVYRSEEHTSELQSH